MRQLRESELNTNQTLAPLLNPVKNSKPPLTTEAMPKPPKPAPGVTGLWQRLAQMVPKRRARPTPATATAMRSLDAGHGSLFTKRRKLIMGGIAILAVVLVAGILTYQHNKKVAAERAVWEQKFSQAADYRNRAESSLMYAKDSQTRSEIQQSESILSGLDTNTDDKKKRVADLQSEIAQIKEKLRKASIASNVSELYSLPVTAPDGSLAAPVLTDKAAYTVDNSSRQIVKIDLSNRTPKNIPLPSQTNQIIAASLGEKSLVLLDRKGMFYALNLQDDSLQALNKIPQATSTAITDMVIYNKKAYVLDGTNGKIVRLLKTATGFGNVATYAQSTNVPLAGAVAMAIDSNVFVAKADGSVLRLLSGKQEAFSLSQIDPPLRALSSIWTEMDDTRLIVTDPADKRLVLFDKNGLLTAQLTSPEFSALRDVSSRLSQKQALVISGNRLLLVPLP